MRVPLYVLSVARTAVVLGFVALTAVIFGYLWVNAGGKIPFVTNPGYRVTVPLSDVDNLVQQADVWAAGVPVGKVESVAVEGSAAVVTLDLVESIAPLHEGATVRIRNKTLVEETYLDLTDGTGAELPDGAVLPPSAGSASVQLDDVLTSLDQPTRDALSNTIRSAAETTEGAREDVAAAVAGLGDLGREGGTALDALAAQSADLADVTVHTTEVLEALDTGRGQIAELVTDADRLTQVVAGNRADLEAVMRELPGVLASARDASGGLDTLAGSLAPVASNLRVAGPDLAAALQELPATSADLRGLVPALDRTLQRAPDTLVRVPAFTDATREFVPTLQVNLADLNPALGYLRPYGTDVALWFAGLGQALSAADGNGTMLRVMTVFNEKSPNHPVDSQVGPLTKRNPYPEPGAAADPQREFTGEYPRVEEDPPR